MTTENIYTAIIEMLRCYDAETGREGETDRFLRNDRNMRELAVFNACPNIYASAARVLLDLREKMDKKTTDAGRVNACKRIIKNCTHNRVDLAGVGYDEKSETYYILDGYRMIRFREDLPSLPRMPGRFEHERAMPGPDAVTDELLPVPSAGEIKAFCAENGVTRATVQKLKSAFTPQGWPGWVAVNPFYLLDMLEALPEAKIYKPARAWTPILFRDDAGNDGILLPCRTENAVRAWNEEDERRQVERHNRKSEVA